MDHFAKAEGKAAVSRARIVAMAAPLFAERGYGATSIRDIAQAVGMTTASLYYHFSGKDELFAAVHARALQSVADAVTQAAAGLQEPWERLEAAAAAHCGALMGKGTAAVLVDMMYGGAQDVRAELVRQRDEYERFFHSFIDAAPMLPDVDRRLLRLQILGAMNMMAFWFTPKGPMTAEEIGRNLIHNLRAGVAAPQSSTKAPTRRQQQKRDRRKL